MLNKIFEKEINNVDFSFNMKKPFEKVKQQVKQSRTKLWELDHIYHCAIIGTCLTMDEVRRLLRSFRLNIDNDCSYEIHTTIVTLISFKDYPSKKVQSYLDKKFKSALQKTRKMNADELKEEWKRVLNNGELIATFWAVISHPCTNEKMKKYFYGDIHMLSHMSGASNRADLKRLKSLEQSHKEFNSEAQTQQVKYQKLQATNIDLQKSIQLQTEKIDDLVNQVSALSNANEHLMVLNDVNKCKQLISQIEKLSYKIIFQENEMVKSHNKVAQLEKVITGLNRQANNYQKTITVNKNEIEHLQYLLSKNQEEGECLFKTPGLCGQCILYVGGKSNLIPHYRELVEEKDGAFIHHDGGLEKNTQDLSNSLKRADLVVFPSDCISHEAYWKIKRTCKKQQKPYKYLQSAGLHSLSNMLDKIAEKNMTLDA
ncbi:MAG: DUF2325 domain-containing protein [Methylococcaceae bacterium]|nr:DUF2325 domain-containing protein [Methylococcaceae bacterium]